jgi:hypothetical protein
MDPLLNFKFLIEWDGPSEYTALPELDASDNGVALESMTLLNEGWQRDDTFTAPAPVDGPSVDHPDSSGTS